jgi:hypothetical protein
VNGSRSDVELAAKAAFVEAKTDPRAMTRAILRRPLASLPLLTAPLKQAVLGADYMTRVFGIRATRRRPRRCSRGFP